MTIQQNFCVNCGAALVPGIIACKKCGRQISDDPVKTVEPSQPPSRPVARPPKPEPAKPLLPPQVAVPSAPPSRPAVATPSANKKTPWLLFVLGLALFVVLTAVGVRLLSNPTSVVDSVGSQTPLKAVVTASAHPELLRPEPTAKTTTGSPKPTPPSPQATRSPLPLNTENIPGIEAIPLSEPESYLPFPNTRYRHFLRYPDGDEGVRELLAGRLDGSQALTTVELTHSKLYPNDPPGLWVTHYVTRANGVYRVPDDDLSQAELHLPKNLAKGTRWSNSTGRYEVVAFDKDLTVNGTRFSGVLAYRLQNKELGLDQTTWLAPGLGEILVQPGQGGQDICRFLSADPEDAKTIEKQLLRHSANQKKVK